MKNDSIFFFFFHIKITISTFKSNYAYLLPIMVYQPILLIMNRRKEFIISLFSHVKQIGSQRTCVNCENDKTSYT